MHPLPENMGHRSWAGYLQKAGGAYEGGNNVESEVGKGSTFSFSLRLKIASCNENRNGKSKSVDTEEQYKNVKYFWWKTAPLICK